MPPAPAPMTEAALSEAGEAVEVVDLAEEGVEDTKLPPYSILLSTEDILKPSSLPEKGAI